MNAKPASSTMKRDRPNEVEYADALTERVVTAYSGIDDSRLRDLVTGLVRHLHAFVKEASLTDSEFEAGWTLMAEMAKFTGRERNEFLLFCDLVGISELIDAINHARSPSAVGYALVGPFYRANAPVKQRGATIASDDTTGDRVRASPAESRTWPPMSQLQVRRWTYGRPPRTASMSVRTRTSRTTTCAAASRRIGQALSS